MLYRFLQFGLIGFCIGVAPAIGQDGSALENLQSAFGTAAKELRDAANDKLLIRDLIGADVKGPDGEVVGTVANLVALPGGRIVAALIETGETDGPIPVPFTVIKVSNTADKLDLTLPATPSELAEAPAMEDFRKALPKL